MRMRFALAALVALGAATTAMAGRHVTAEPGEEVSDGLIVHFRQGALFSGAKVPARFLGDSRWQAMRLPNRRRLQVDPADHLTVGAALAADPAVELVEPDRVRHVALAAPDDPRYSEQWHMAAIRAQQAWQWFPGRYLTSLLNLNRVRVAVIDTGVDCTHPDFANAGGTSTDTAAGGQLNWARSVAAVLTTVSPAACAWQDDNGHGTAMAGLVAAATNNQTGVASLGAMLELAIYKVANASGSSTDSRLADAIVAAADDGAKVVTISLSGPGYSQAMQDACDYAWSRNVIVVTAAGNNNGSTLVFPAGNNHVIAVSAIDTNGAIAVFSNRGDSIDMAAPGVSILTTTPVAGSRYGPSYASILGTSVAAPQVAALAGLLAMASPGVPADSVVLRIERSADLAQDGRSPDLGWGRIDAERAITGVNWRASGLGGVGGQIRDSAGLALAGATVTLNSTAFTTLSAGIFSFTGIAPGDYTMTVAAPGQSALSVPITVVAGADTPTHLQMGVPHGTFTGTATLSGSPQAGMVVTASQGGAVRGVALTNATGQYRLYVPAGTYELRAGTMFGTASSLASQTVSADGTTNAAPLASQNMGRLEGTIRNALNATVAGAQVVVAQTGRSLGAVSGVNGDYRTIPGPAGDYLAGGEDAVAGSSTPASVSIVNSTIGRFDIVLRTSAQTTRLDPAAASFNAIGGPGSSSIGAGSSSLPWLATSSAPWLTIGSAASGRGSATLGYTVAPNPDPASRSATIQVNEAVLTVTQTGATAAVTVDPATVSVPENGASRTLAITSSGIWAAISLDSWITLGQPAAASGNGTLSFSALANSSTQGRSGSIRVNGVTITVTQPGALTINPSSTSMIAAGGQGSFNVSSTAGWSVTSNSVWITVTANAGSGNGTVNYNVAPNLDALARSGSISVGTRVFTISQAAAAAAAGPPISSSGLHFVPVTPCRIVDTRENLGQFGKPALTPDAPRSFPIPSTSCGIPGAAKAYALNVTVVPKGPLGYITIFPTGQPQPLVSTLNSIDGRVKANAALVPAGTGGAISVTATNPVELILDISGYFVDAGSDAAALAFYPITQCRVADTRNATGGLGGPILAANGVRSLPVLSSSCGIPSNARAYSINATVVPSGPLGYLTLWPAGQALPLVSTLNAPTGTIVANAAIVPAGSGGAINAFATSATHLVVDINGYFAPAGAANAQRFYPVSPCRVLDSRNPNGGLGGPALSAGQTRTWPIPSSSCGLPAGASAFSLNATVVPTAGLGYLTLWAAGQAQPLTSTLNAIDDPIVANAAIVVAGSGGAISSFTTSQTQLILDTNGFFAP